MQQQALRVDQDMTLLALDQLARVEAVAVDDAGRRAGFALGFLATLEVRIAGG